MDYSELLWRCRRAAGLGPDSLTDLTLTDLLRLLHQYPAGVGRHVIAETLAHEMAEWIEQTAHPAAAAAKKAH